MTHPAGLAWRGLWRAPRQSLGRALLLPLRLGSLWVLLVALLGQVGLQMHRDAELARKQRALQSLMGRESAWIASLEPRLPADARGSRPSMAELDDLDAWLSQSEPAAALTLRPVALRPTGSSEPRWVRLLLVNAAFGAPGRGSGGTLPCAWVTEDAYPAGPLRVGDAHLCSPTALDPGWRALRGELLAELLLMPHQIAGELLGPQPRQQYAALIGVGSAFCAGLPEAPAAAVWRCNRLASSSGVQAQAAQSMHALQGQVQVALAACCAAALLFYLFGQQRLLLRELALRRALGRPLARLVAWVSADTLCQALILLLPVALPAAGILGALSLSPASLDRPLLSGAAVAALAALVVHSAMVMLRLRRLDIASSLKQW